MVSFRFLWCERMERMERMERSQGPKIKVLNVNSCFYLFDFLIWAVLMNYEQRNDLQNDLGASYPADKFFLLLDIGPHLQIQRSP